MKLTQQVSRRVQQLVLALLVLVPAELFSYFVAQILVDRSVLYSPPAEIDFAQYLEDRDPLLGWPSPQSIGTGEFDASGSRIVPAFPDPETPACVDLFGDSFTWGDEVTPEQAWGSILAERMNCRVANYGVGGYGTDQAFLRYRDRITSRAPIVMLGFWSENIVRNMNRYRGFVAHGADVGFKPRFKAAGPDADLAFVPMPSPDQPDFSVLDIGDDWFAPGAGGGLKVARFPYTLAVVRGLRHYKIIAALRREPAYAQFYDEQNQSDGLQTTLAILREFASVTTQRNQRGVVVLMPSDFDLEQLRSTGATYYQPLAEALRRLGIETLDTAPLFLADLGEITDPAGRPACEIYLQCGGHLTTEGNEWLAGYVHAYLSRADASATADDSGSR